MNTISQPYLRKFLLVFLDDILVYSRSIKDRMIHSNEVLSVFEQHHFFINASKCAFMETELEYLRHFIFRNGVKMDQRKIETITDWPLP